MNKLNAEKAITLITSWLHLYRTKNMTAEEVCASIHSLLTELEVKHD